MKEAKKEKERKKIKGAKKERKKMKEAQKERT